MNIDWFTFTAQIINFLILVGLLRWLLYRPIIEAMEQRESTIEQRWKEAEEKYAEASNRVEDFQRKKAELETQRDDLLREAAHRAKEHREQLIREARDDVESKRTQWLDALARDKTETAAEIRATLGELVIETTRHLLSELADESLEELFTRKFIAAIKSLDDERKTSIVALLQDGATPFLVRSSFKLDESTQEKLRKIVAETLDHRAEVQFEQSSDLICGLRLEAGGYSIDWNVADFVRQIEIDFGERTRRQHDDER